MVVGLWKVESVKSEHYSANYWHLYEDGTLNVPGTWDFEKGQFQLTYWNGLIWKGEFNNNVIQGNIRYRDGHTEDFYALKISRDPDHKVVSYVACLLDGKLDGNLKCIDKEESPCRVFTGLTFMIYSQCEEHCQEEADRRGIKCLTKP
jgi:hypothetical protein